MAQVFHRSVNTIAKASIVAAVLLGGIGFYVVTQIARSSYITGVDVDKQQPVQFSHKHHSGDDGIDCRYCHTSVETSSYSGYPPTATCMNCHSQIWSDSPYLEIVRASYRDNKPIEWQKVHDLPDYVYFNHSIHIAKGVGCSTCHGNMSEMPGIHQVNTLQMEWCLSCHKEPEKFLRPKAEIYNPEWRPENTTAEQIELGEQLKVEYKVRGRDLMTACSTCHR
ncbi:MAG: cytochrome c3 family protein [Pyrinomonadaceae bacterium]|nr:cytochrome c3 family protein [Pyrinomonadaceae bacterium]